ncbi:MAG: hypothetical protein N4A38_05295 [Candidatus Gracilibacteria bacterium]|nr:hypothetical protein [Candidatus Gracilibacteria bacterium]
MEYVIIENHFGVPENEIRAFTRNGCGEDLSLIINEIISILYPNEKIEILFLPPENGSFKDILKIVGTGVVSVSTVGAFVFSALTYFDSHEKSVHDKEMRIIDDNIKCLKFKKLLEDYKKQGYEVEGIEEEKMKKICGNLFIKKIKNNRIDKLIKDDMVSSDEIKLFDSTKKIIKEKKIEKDDFEKYIEYIPENEDFLREDLEGVIEIISPVIKQEKKGGGLTWKGTYFGEYIKEHGIDILINGDIINFYMQDEGFKENIKNHEVTFGNEDNIEVIFSLKCSLALDGPKNKKIYIKKVKKMNENIVAYKEIASNRKIINTLGQTSLPFE